MQRRKKKTCGRHTENKNLNGTNKFNYINNNSKGDRMQQSNKKTEIVRLGKNLSSTICV